MIKTKVLFETFSDCSGRLFSSQSVLFETFSDCSDWLDKSRPSKKATFVLICKQANNDFFATQKDTSNIFDILRPNQHFHPDLIDTKTKSKTPTKPGFRGASTFETITRPFTSK